MTRGDIAMNKSSKKDIYIREAKPSDFPEAILLWKKAGLSIPDVKKEFLEFQYVLRMNSSSCLVLVQDKTIIGSALGIFNGRRGWIYHLAIHPDFQHQGYGSLLLKKAEKELKKKGAHRVLLCVEYTNLKVAPFYEKYGYVVINDALWLGKNI